MKPLTKNYKVLATLVVMGLSSAQTTLAASAFSSDATLTYAITNITNLSNPGDLSGLQILGYFEQAGAPDSYVATTGDGAIAADNPTVGPVSVETSFSRTFAVGGNVTDGTVASSHLGWFRLDFNNLGSDSYAIELALDFELTATASGQSADTDIFLDYFRTSSSDSFLPGFTNVSPSLGFGFVNASVFGLDNAATSGSSGPLLFSLGPNASEGLHADVWINGNLQASPVPLPAAVWFFITGLLTFSSMRKRKAMA
ncbi:VPLPA-CTERM sorting domain-containing protein [Methylocaldum gracile]|jgi:hypothetical protein|uniref:VPLPA-CTERM sorting domain-containing protein n=1 Tax=unclassified Methylocaldum TaxID=2622260 RepID=UPI00105D9C11